VRAIPYFINSVKYNLAGSNAHSSFERCSNVSASLRVITAVAYQIRLRRLNYAQNVIENFHDDFKKALELVKGENNKILKLKNECLSAWVALERYVREEDIGAKYQSKPGGSLEFT
jgi:hypothetical protein